MQHMLTPYAPTIESFAWWDGAFTNEELNWLQDQAKKAQNYGQVGIETNDINLSDIRRSKICWMHKKNENAWVYERLADVASKLNSQFFRFDITGFGEPIQMTNYDQSEHGMYNWHQDYNAQISRKLSLVLQLTDPSQYEGGNLQIMTSGQPETIKKQRGLIVAFPSYTLHQVTPVTHGSRQTLVTWISGPAFK